MHEVALHENVQSQSNQGTFLTNEKNKCAFVAQLIKYLQAANFMTL